MGCPQTRRPAVTYRVEASGFFVRCRGLCPRCGTEIVTHYFREDYLAKESFHKLMREHRGGCQ